MPEGCITVAGLWCVADVPHKGWECICVEDREDNRMICEMCQTAEIRYAHHIQHEEYDRTLMVGRLCAEALCAGYDGEAVEEDVRSRANSWRWMLTELVWRESKNSVSIWCRTRDDFLAIVFWHDNRFGDTKYGYVVKDLYSRSEHSFNDLRNIHEAKERALLTIQNMRKNRV